MRSARVPQQMNMVYAERDADIQFESTPCDT